MDKKQEKTSREIRNKGHSEWTISRRRPPERLETTGVRQKIQ